MCHCVGHFQSVWYEWQKWPVFNYTFHLYSVLMQNLHIWNFHGSLTMNNMKPIWYFTNSLYSIVSNMTNFLRKKWPILIYMFYLYWWKMKTFGIFSLAWEKKMTCFELCASSVLTQNQHIWNFHGSLTLNKGKLIRYCRSPWYAIVSNMIYFGHNALFSASWVKVLFQPNIRLAACNNIKAVMF